MKKLLLMLPMVTLLVSCMAPPPSGRVKYLQKDTLAEKVDRIMKNPSLTEEEKKQRILMLFARKRKEWSAQNIYTKEKAKKLAEMLSLPATPLHTPPKILRILILPWVDKDGTFHGAHYVYIQVDSGEWVLGSYTLQNLDGSSKTLTPLER